MSALGGGSGLREFLPVIDRFVGACRQANEGWVDIVTAVLRLGFVLVLASFAAACSDGAESGATPTIDTTSAASTADSTTAAPRTTSTSIPSTSPSTAPSTTPPTTAADSTTTEPPVLGAELVGRWAHYDVVAYEGGTLKTLIVSYGFNDFDMVDGELVDSTQFCFSEQFTDQPIETSLADAATQAIKPPTTPVEVDQLDGALRLRRAATPTPVGIRLDDPANEPLPTDPNDPRIVDDDGDGQPGVTVTIRVTDDLTGELYIARREIFAYDVVQVGADTLTGTVTDGSEQLVIGASDPIFADAGNDWVQFADLAKSPIILERVEPDWDCDRLAAERPTLFPPNPTIDW